MAARKPEFECMKARRLERYTDIHLARRSFDDQRHRARYRGSIRLIGEPNWSFVPRRMKQGLHEELVRECAKLGPSKTSDPNEQAQQDRVHK